MPEDKKLILSQHLESAKTMNRKESIQEGKTET